MPGTRRVSMSDVAARAGVSGQTVSRVVHGSPRVDPATRARVEEALAALGYRPHAAARALRTGRSQTIGVVVATLASVGNSRMLEAVADSAAVHGYALTVVTVPGPAAIHDAFDRLRDQGVDGAIVLNEASALTGAARVPAGLRLLVVDAPPEAETDAVEADHVGGARLATAHLLELGHATVAHLAGPADSYAAAGREAGWRAALVEAGRPILEPVRGDWTSASGYRAGAALATDDAVTAVFAANDQMALGLRRALAEAGRVVPEAVSIVGFDDVPDAAQYAPPLTTVAQDFDMLGRRAVATLVAGIEGAPPSGRFTAPVRLIVRASTARPPGASA